MFDSKLRAATHDRTINIKLQSYILKIKFDLENTYQKSVKVVLLNLA